MTTRNLVNTTGLTLNNCTLCPHCIYVFRIYLRTNSDFCPIHHKLTGFCNRVEKCLQRGTDWVFKKRLSPIRLERVKLVCRWIYVTSGICMFQNRQTFFFMMKLCACQSRLTIGTDFHHWVCYERKCVPIEGAWLLTPSFTISDVWKYVYVGYLTLDAIC